MRLVAICLVVLQRMHLSGTITKIWRLKDNGVTTSQGSTSYGWSIVTMHLSSTVTEI